jgi:hypothetical protein
MDHEKGAFFSEHEASDVTGFAVIDVNESSERYRIAEKWERSGDDDIWHSYWIGAKALGERVDKGAVEYRQQLSEKQFEGFVKKAT